jgi:PIN domain nuclease of toxin-antitoxin system
LVERLRIPVIPFDASQARITASFRKHTRSVGMSLGDQACLALALKMGAPAFTTEKEWLECDVGVRVVKIR